MSSLAGAILTAKHLAEAGYRAALAHAWPDLPAPSFYARLRALDSVPVEYPRGEPLTDREERLLRQGLRRMRESHRKGAQSRALLSPQVQLGDQECLRS